MFSVFLILVPRSRSLVRAYVMSFLKIGVHVLVLDQRRQGKGKLSDRWETQPHVIVARLFSADCPVYKIRPEGEEGPERILHRNNPCPCLPCLAPQTANSNEPQVTETNPGSVVWGLALPFNLGGANEEAQAPVLRRSQRENSRRPSRYMG